MNRSETIGKIAAALVKAQAAMDNALKDSSNPFFKSKFADLNAVREACIPALNANGITALQPTVTQDGKAFVETLLLHESGEFISSLTEIISAKQNDPQAHGSGISYARRYGLQSFVNLGSEDDDGERAMGRQSFTPPPKKTIVQEVQAKVQPAQQATNAAPTPSSAAPVKKTVGFNKPKATTPALSAGENIQTDIDL